MRNLTISEKLKSLENSRKSALEEIEFFARHIVLEKMACEQNYMNGTNYESKLVENAKRIANLVEVIGMQEDIKKILIEEK